MPAAIHTGLDSLPSVLTGPAAAPLLVVADRNALRASGLEAELARALSGRPVATFDRVEPNPTLELAQEAASLAQASGAAMVVSVGGGSAMDLAKLAALLAPLAQARWHDPKRPRATDPPPLPHIAIPTTAGSGSEATQFAVVYVDGVKRSIDHPSLRPVAAVLDVRLHLAMPAQVAAASGLDALCQAIESRWAVGSNDRSIPMSIDAGTAVAGHIVESVTLASPLSREAMMHAAHRAGQAIDITRTTAAHALSYPLSQTLRIPHGHAVALTIGAVARFNALTRRDTCNDPRGVAHVRRAVDSACAMLGVPADGLDSTMRRLMDDLGMAPSLGQVGLDLSQIAAIASAVDPVRLSNNPRRLTREDLEAILVESL